MTLAVPAKVTADAYDAALAENGVDLGDAQRALSLFAQGLLGRALHLRAIETAPRDGRLRSILIDGKNLHLPVRIADYPTRRENLAAYRVAILHQIGYLQAGTFDFEPPDSRMASVPTGSTVGTLPAASPLDSMSLWRLPGIGARRPVAALERFFTEACHPALLRRVFGIVEAIRIDARIRVEYPGARADLLRVHRQALSARPDPAAMRPHTALLEALVQHSLGERFAPREADDPLTALLELVQPIGQPNASAALSATVSLAICALLQAVGSLRPIRRLSDRRRGLPLPPGAGEAGETNGPSGNNDPDSNDASRRNADATADEQVDNSDVPTDEGEDASGAPPGPGGDTQPPSAALADLNDLSDMGPGVAFHGVLAADLVDQSRSVLRKRRTVAGAQVPITSATEADDETGTPDNNAAANDTAKDTDSTAKPASNAHLRRHRQARDSQHSFLYDEWDYVQQRYRTAWCRVLEERLHGDDADFIGEVRRRHAALRSQVRRQFASIRPDAFRRVHRTPDGDEFELSSLIDAVIDRRSGHASDEFLYMRRERAQREVATAFLVDMSASTDFPIPEASKARQDDATPTPIEPGNTEHHTYLYGGYQDWDSLPPSPARRRVIDVQKDALALMCDALQTLGDSHAIYGFSGEGRHQVEFRLIKEFSDRLSARIWAAMAAMKPRRSTRMGAAIRHAAAKLRREPSRRKVLIIVSDGYPEDDDYGPERGDAEYGIRDTAKALQEAERAGLTTFCVTVDPAGHDYLRRMCAPDRYLVIDDVADLPGELTKVYRTLTAF